MTGASMAKKLTTGKHDPKPCPTCFAAMVEIRKGVWSCARHGEPTRP